MESNKIEDNPSHKDLKTKLDGANAIHGVVKFLELFGIKNMELSTAFNKLADTKKQFELLSKGPDKFNSYFARKGWIAHESMNADFMLTCIEFAEKGEIDIAEEALKNYYTSDSIYWLVSQLRGVKAFSKRHHLIELAYQDTLEQRFHSAIPIILMMIDGAVNDIDKERGFFSENINLTAWDSIAAHSSGLSVLKDILSASRKTTEEDTIFMPYRHGILHGRDLGYANRVVASKCWAAIFAVKDWARSIEEGKRNAPPEKPEPSLKESIQNLKQSLESLAKTKKEAKKIDAWKPREIIIGIDIPEKGEVTDYSTLSPEQEAIKFSENWARKKYGLIAKQIHHFSKKDISEKKEAGKARAALEPNHLIDYRITKIVDFAPAISEVTLVYTMNHDGKTHQKEIILRLIYQDSKDNILVRGTADGQWKFIENFFYQLEYLF